MVSVYSHSDPRASWSRVKHVLDCPAQARWLAAQEREDSAAMAAGRLLHCAILEPDTLARRYSSPPAVVRLTGWEPTGKRGEGWRMSARPGEQWPTKGEAEAVATPWGWVSDQLPMPVAGYATAEEARSALGRLVTGEWVDDALLAIAQEWGAQARALLPSGLAEVPLYGQIEGVKARGCADLVTDQPAVVDVKTTSKVGARDVARSAADSRWHGQLGTYAMLATQQPTWRPNYSLGDIGMAILIVQAPACNIVGNVLRAATTQPRPHARIEWLSCDGQAYAIAQARKAWRLWRDCSSAGVWPDHVGGLEPARWQMSDANGVEEVEPW